MIYNIFYIGVTINYEMFVLNDWSRYTIVKHINIILPIENHESIELKSLYDITTVIESNNEVVFYDKANY